MVGYFGVSDGVGDWHKFGVDPSGYSRALMRGAERAVREAAAMAGSALTKRGHGGVAPLVDAEPPKKRKRGRPKKSDSSDTEAPNSAAPVPQPLVPVIPGPIEIMRYAWQYAAEQSTVGSATTCLVTVDPLRSQLVAANLGDSGFIVVRPR